MGLQEEYKILLQKHNMEIMDEHENISTVLRDLLSHFMSTHKRVAVYCYGAHTRALMAEYIFELRNIVCIVDNGNVEVKNKGFTVIQDQEIEGMRIDGVIISSYRYKEEIKSSLLKNHEGLDFLDLYDAMQEQGISMQCEFYLFRTPYQSYVEMNRLYQKIDQRENVTEALLKLVSKFVEIKDFQLAAKAAEALYDVSDEQQYKVLKKDIEDLYQKELGVLNKGGEAVLLMCVDGLKAQEFCREGRMKKTYAAVKKKATIFTRAYSYSTSTFESLIPVFTENYDQRSEGYMKTTTASLADCRFATFAREQGRNIYIYGSGIKYIDDPEIKYIEYPQTITQMIWSFANDLESDPKGLFYMQPVYESHFTFPSPYYKQNDMEIDGTNLFYNYLSTKGSKLNKRYSGQYDVAIRYVDDTLSPVLGELGCKTLLFADHGDYDYEEIEGTNLGDIDPNHIMACEALFRIPMAIISPDESGEIHSVISLSELNDIAISMMKNEKFDYRAKEYIKVGRTAIYNADCKHIYKNILHSEHRLCAFEGFVFEDGYKLLVFSDGTKELYQTAEDVIVQNEELTEKYYKRIENELTIFEKT